MEIKIGVDDAECWELRGVPLQSVLQEGDWITVLHPADPTVVWAVHQAYKGRSHRSAVTGVVLDCDGDGSLTLLPGDPAAQIEFQRPGDPAYLGEVVPVEVAAEMFLALRHGYDTWEPLAKSVLGALLPKRDDPQQTQALVRPAGEPRPGVRLSAASDSECELSPYGGQVDARRWAGLTWSSLACALDSHHVPESRRVREVHAAIWLVGKWTQDNGCADPDRILEEFVSFVLPVTRPTPAAVAKRWHRFRMPERCDKGRLDLIARNAWPAGL